MRYEPASLPAGTEDILTLLALDTKVDLPLRAGAQVEVARWRGCKQQEMSMPKRHRQVPTGV